MLTVLLHFALAFAKGNMNISFTAILFAMACDAYIIFNLIEILKAVLL